MVTSKFGNRYSKTGLWQLFVATAFPLHLWAIILILMDISWVAERTNFWDAIGVAAYGLVFILFESLLIWALLILMGFLLPKIWPENKRVVLLGILVMVTALWAILGQLYFLLELSFPQWIINLLAEQAHPLRYLYAIYLVVVTLSVLLATYFAIISEKFQRSFVVVIDRLSILVGLYVILDVVSIIIVLIRNLG
ncbi:hypothetical protein ACFLXI_08885 [Chloroflexota bacterium]